VGICIQTGWIVWINGPYPPGDFPDVSISRDGLTDALAFDELFLADEGYADSCGYADTPHGDQDHDEDQVMKKNARARHETINEIFKEFHVLKDCFRHHRTKHGSRVFTAVANITQAKIQLEKCIHQVYYNDNYLY
jgi:hypothetical protein